MKIVLTLCFKFTSGQENARVFAELDRTTGARGEMQRQHRSSWALASLSRERR